jgi:hypothetical protein
MRFYNPEKGTNVETYGDISVRLLKAEKEDGFVVGKLQVCQGDEIREVRHYWCVTSPPRIA